ncbi:hypothetical protein BpHYR1_054562 [Brachionus plicatilis]|uniref:Uncharacterized protein n=1 Tax=Brachionus plicatilis TaxID=10195 RepID=A0A3M7SF70_BRAPC|nr:hypothetical protein BpHYR1_054562 [Brachionus plicatilis]
MVLFYFNYYSILKSYRSFKILVVIITTLLIASFLSRFFFAKSISQARFECCYLKSELFISRLFKI